jgi:hypothetical protein
MTLSENIIANLSRTSSSEMKLFKTFQGKFKNKDLTFLKTLNEFNERSSRLLGSKVFKKYLMFRNKTFRESISGKKSKLKEFGFSPNNVTLEDIAGKRRLAFELKLTALLDPLTFFLASEGIYYNSSNVFWGDHLVKSRKTSERDQESRNYYYDIPSNFVETVFDYAEINYKSQGITLTREFLVDKIAALVIKADAVLKGMYD